MSGTIWSRRSRADLDRIDEWIRVEDPERADTLRLPAIAATQTLEASPHIGTPIDRGLRKWRVPGTPYLLLCRPGRDGVEIARARHDRENRWP